MVKHVGKQVGNPSSIQPARHIHVQTDCLTSDVFG